MDLLSVVASPRIQTKGKSIIIINEEAYEMKEKLAEALSQLVMWTLYFHGLVQILQS